MEVLNPNTILQPFLITFSLIILMIIMVYLYKKTKIWLVIFLMFLLSLLIGINIILLDYIPFNPYISIGFILFQFIFFILITIKMFKYKTI